MTNHPGHSERPQTSEARSGSRLAPIALFVYNRPWHVRHTVDALKRNELAAESDLVVFCDGARGSSAVKDVEEVRALIRSLDGFRSVRIVERRENLGLAASIVRGVTDVCGEHGRAIVLEDDLVTSQYFLRYMNEALDMYQDDPIVGSIHGYWYPVGRHVSETFFLKGASCWGWATWSRAWRLFEPDGSKSLAELRRTNLTRSFDLDGALDYTKMLKDQIAGKNNSWAIRWHASMYLSQSLQLSPGRSLVRNIGFDGTGTHCGSSDAYNVELAERPISVDRISLRECNDARNALIDYYRSTRRSIHSRAMSRLRRIVGR
jgi:hypothetical protein